MTLQEHRTSPARNRHGDRHKGQSGSGQEPLIPAACGISLSHPSLTPAPGGQPHRTHLEHPLGFPSFQSRIPTVLLMCLCASVTKQAWASAPVSYTHAPFLSHPCKYWYRTQSHPQGAELGVLEETDASSQYWSLAAQVDLASYLHSRKI